MESKKIDFFNKLSFVLLLFTIFACFFFFIPFSPVTLEASKGFLLSVGATLSLFFWFVSRLGEGKFVIPKDKLILFAGAIPLVFLISSFFSPSIYSSLFGSGFEIGTFGSMLVLYVVFFLSAIYFQSEKRIWYFIWSIFLSGVILLLYQTLNLFVDFNSLTPGFVRGVTSGNLVGSWNNFALVVGVIVLLSVITIELVKTKKFFRILQYILLVLGILFLIIINMKLVWILVGAFSLIVFVYSISVQHARSRLSESFNGKKKFPFTSLIIVFIAFISLVGNNLLTNVISSYVNLNNPDIRPSFVTTAQIAFKSFKHNPAFGTGPNTFALDWALWQPKEIAQTVFWGVDFTSGYSLLSTFAVTAGLLGLISLVWFIVLYVTRSIQSIKIALQNNVSNYFIATILMISLYSWISIILYSPNIVVLMLAFVSSGMLIGTLVHKQAIKTKEYSFLTDPRNSFFSILGLVVLMVASISLTYIYVEKFTSLIYYSKSLNAEQTLESLGKSESMLLKAINLDKNDTYYRTLSQVYLAQIGVLAKDTTISEDILKSSMQQLVSNAVTAASGAIEQNPKQYQNYVNLGNLYTELSLISVEGSYDSAVTSYEKALALAPNNPSIFLSQATLEYLNKNNSEARKYIKQALDLKADYTDAIFLLVQIETNEGNLKEAIKQAEYAGQVSPNDATVFFRLGLLKYNNKDYKESVSAFEKAVILNNSYLNARYYLGLAYQKVGRKDDALTQFNLLKQLAPDSEEVKEAIKSIDSKAEVVEEDKEEPLSELDAVKAPIEED
jgi:tetratricopeptide (TPR) repeat protein